jgi:hypothetical protein
MDETARTLIDRMASRKCKPVALSGYVGPDEYDSRRLRIYPGADANHYYVVDLTCPIEMVVIPDDPHDRVTVIVEATSEIETVTRQRVPAGMLSPRQGSRAPRAAAPDGAPGLVIALARTVRHAGADPENGDAGSASQRALHAWNTLLDALGTTAECQAADALCKALLRLLRSDVDSPDAASTR